MFKKKMLENRTFKQLGYRWKIERYPGRSAGHYFSVYDGAYTIEKDTPERYVTSLEVAFESLPLDIQTKVLQIRQYPEKPTNWNISFDGYTEEEEVLAQTPYELYKYHKIKHNSELNRWGIIDSRISLDTDTYKDIMFPAHVCYREPLSTVGWLQKIWKATDLELLIKGCTFPFVYESTDYFTPEYFILCVWHSFYDINDKTLDAWKLSEFFAARMRRLSFIWPAFKVVRQPNVNHFQCQIDPKYTKQMSIQELGEQ